MSRIYIGIGTNLGDKEDNLKQAMSFLSEKVSITKVSSLYETEPVGYQDQPWFLNLVVEGETSLEPSELLEFTQGIEKQMKRIKTIVNGPRIIDVDILWYDQKQIETEILTIPHPRMLERAFVMVPLFEIAPALILSGKTMEAWMENFQGEQIVKRD